ncbi:MAG: NfeD family protein [Clostridiales bacterium]|nr:NfeD family protein [Clostridiales bacterium]
MSVFMILLVIGITIPAMSLIMSFVSESLEGLFAGDGIDGAPEGGFPGDASISFLPASPIIWCAQLIVTGMSGELLTRRAALPSALVWAIALALGYVMVLLLYNGILMPLKKVRNQTSASAELTGRPAVVTEAILQGGVGAVRIEGRSGMVIYAAKSSDSRMIPQGVTVIVTGFESGRAIVTETDTRKN